jgi:hypothetical protein
MAKVKDTPTCGDLQTRLDYDPDTGVFTWKARLEGTRQSRHFNTVYAGKVAGSVETTGYRVIWIDGKRYKAHRLAMVYMSHAVECIQVDHIDGDKENNRYSNLRLATPSENSQNLAAPAGRLMGAYFRPKDGFWVASIRLNRRSHYLGCFSSAELAHDAYTSAKSRLHIFQPTLRVAR